MMTMMLTMMMIIVVIIPVLSRAYPDLNQGPADLQSAALTTELCTQVMSTAKIETSQCGIKESKVAGGPQTRSRDLPTWRPLCSAPACSAVSAL